MSRAVLFDLFGTLVPGGSRERRDAVSRAMADDLGVDGDAFAALIRDTFDARVRGSLGNLHETIAELAGRLGRAPTLAGVARAAKRRLALHRDLHQETWALPILEDLKATGIRIGVVSDCSAETPALWPETTLSQWVDATAFSCVVGVRKPDPRIYLATTDALKVRPTDCTYVGDGASNELSGARALGMRPIWFNNTAGELIDRPDEEADWTGERITNLTQLLALLAP